MNLCRPQKLSHAETILYEIDMLRFSAQRFQEPCRWDCWRNLECFLLHFRNLIEFFGREPLLLKRSGKERKTTDDLSILRPEKIWTDPATRPTADKLKQLHREDLWEKYEWREVGSEKENDKISRYLQHCTEQRVESKDWDVKVMFEELSTTVSEFENLLPNKDRSWGNLPTQGVEILTQAPLSTNTKA